MVLLLALACRKSDTASSTALAPSITVDAPVPGAFVGDGRVPVTGAVTGLDDVTVNGVSARRVGDRFDAEVDAPRGMVPVEVVGRDRHGNAWTERYTVLAGDFAEPEGPVLDAVVLRLNRAGLDHLGGMISGLLVPADLLADMTAAGDPVFDVFIPSVWPLDDTDVDIYLTALSFDPLRVTAEPGAGVLRLDVRLPSIAVELQTWGTIPLLANTEGDLIRMSADEVHIAVDVSMDVGPDGAVRATLANPSVQMPGFQISWDYLWTGVDWVLDLFLDLQTMMEDALVGALEDSVPALLSSVFGALNTTFEMPLFDRVVSLRMQLAEIAADPDGVQFGAHLAVSVPGARARSTGGWLTSPPGGAPSPSRTAPMSAAISDDLLNRALYELWAAELLSMTLSTEDGSLDALMLAPLGATQGAVGIDLGLPPAVVERDGRFVAQLGEVALHLDTPGGEKGDFLDVTLGAETALDLTIEDQELRLAIGTPDLRLAVRDSDWGASNDTITTLLEQQLPLDVILLLLGEFAFPLPELPGITIGRAIAERDPSGVHTDLELTFE